MIRELLNQIGLTQDERQWHPDPSTQEARMRRRPWKNAPWQYRPFTADEMEEDALAAERQRW
jgi:hypothetical protein